MEMERRESGLVVPSRPQEPQRKLSPLEIVDAEDRAKTRVLLGQLYRAMGLNRGGGGILGGTREQVVAQRRLFDFFGQSVLGPDAPLSESFEELC